MPYSFVGSNSTESATVTYTATAGNTLIVVNAGQTIGSSLTLSDTNNTYSFVGGSSTVSTLLINAWIAPVTVGGSLTINLTPTSGNGFGIYVAEYSGLGSLVASSFQSQVQAGPGIGANILTTSSNPNVTSAPAMLWGFSLNANALSTPSPDVGPSVGTTLSYTSRTIGWLGSSTNQVALAEDIRITSTGTNPITFGSVSGNQFDGFATIAFAIAEASGTPAPPSPIYHRKNVLYFI
jgi:hypothetical protein